MFFRDNYDYLSNMYECPVAVMIDNVVYTFKCSESAYQACKCPERVQEFIDLNGYEAKRLGRKVQIRPDWEELKFGFMYAIVKAKFDQNPFLQLRLKALQGEITEDNTWNDTYWGRCNGIGENNLGKILMDLRDYYNPFYCLVVGSRGFDNYQLMCNVLDHLLQNKKYVVIVSGGAKGADTHAERYANEHSNCRLKIFEAHWNDIQGLPNSAIGYRNGEPYRKRAGYERNEQMHLYLCSPSDNDRGVVAFWDGSSKGTAHNFELSIKYNNPIKIYNYVTNSFILNPYSYNYL